MGDHLTNRGGFVISALVAGGAFLAQAIISPLTASHAAYHAVDAVLALATAVALFAVARHQPVWSSGPARAAAWGGALIGLVLGVGDMIAALAEIAAASEIGIVEGIVHSFVLLLLLALAFFGAALRGAAKLPGLLLGGASLLLLVMVLGGLDQPEQFLIPELLLGCGWLWLATTVRAETTSTPSGQNAEARPTI